MAHLSVVVDPLNPPTSSGLKALLGDEWDSLDVCAAHWLPPNLLDWSLVSFPSRFCRQEALHNCCCFFQFLEPFSATGLILIFPHGNPHTPHEGY